MPLCPQITITPVTVTSTGMTTSNTDGVYSLDTSSPAFTSTQSAATNAATQAAQALTDAAAAQTAATNAVTTANQAQATANGKNKVTYSTSDPSGSGTTSGDIWWKYSGGNIVGYWVWNGSSWVSQTVSNTVIGNLDAGKITTGTLSASIIIQGPIIRTAASGARVQLDSTGLVAYNSGGSAVTSISASTGAITASGGTFSGSVTSSSGTIGGFTLSSNALTSATSSSFYIGNNGGWQCDSLNAVSSATSAVYIPNGGLQIGSSYSWNSSGNITANKVGCNNIGNSTMTIDSTTLYGNSTLYNAAISGRAVQMLGGAGSYQIACTTSTRRNKQQIADASVEFSGLLRLPVQQFKLNREVEALGSSAPVHYGLMAEDVAEAGFEWLVDRDESGQPSYIYWSERMPQALFAIVQKQAETIAALEARIVALEEKVNA